MKLLQEKLFSVYSSADLLTSKQKKDTLFTSYLTGLTNEEYR